MYRARGLQTRGPREKQGDAGEGENRGCEGYLEGCIDLWW